MLAIDHVFYAVENLDRASRRFRDDLGLTAVPGGVHEGYGTGNAIIPLGDTFIELLAVVEAHVAADSMLGQFVTAKLRAGGDQLLGWCVRTDDIDGVARRLAISANRGGRTLPDDSSLSWRLAGLEVALGDPQLPFFVQWDDPDRHPSKMSAEHPSGANGIALVEVAGDAGRIKQWLGESELPVRVVDGEPGVTQVDVVTRDGSTIALR